MVALSSSQCSHSSAAGHAIQRIYVVQTGHMGASQMIGGHLLIFYPPYVAADPVDQNRKRLKSLLHGCAPLSRMLLLKSQRSDYTTWMLKCQQQEFRTAHYSLIIASHGAGRSRRGFRVVLSSRKAWSCENTAKPSPDQLRQDFAFDHIKCHRQVWDTWG